MTVGPLPRMAPKTIGKMRVDALVDAVGPTRLPHEMLRDVPEGIVEAHADWISPYIDAGSGRMILAYQSFLIQLDGLNILVDCAIGEDGEFPARPDWHHGKSDWLNHMGRAGLSPEDVDIVFLTHLHVDHTGWLTRKIDGIWQPTFPKARHLTSQAELDYWPARHTEFAYMAQSVPDCVEPVLEAGLFENVAPGDDLAPGLSVADLAGHTPGMIGLEYSEGGTLRAAFNADLMHHPLQMADPSMATMFCSDPQQAVETREGKLNEYADAQAVMFCGHFPGESAGLAVWRGEGFAFERA